MIEARKITNLDVSVICLGTMTFGTPVPADEAVRLVHWALDHGVNFIDTADAYEGYNRVLGSPGGVAEQILGDALHDRRERAIVTTKVGNPVGPGPDDTGLGRTHMTRQIDASLRRMRTTYVDFYELHRPDPQTPLAESIAVMAELIAAGKVRHWGFSNYPADQTRELMRLCDDNRWPRPVISQPPYSWLKRDIEEQELPACREFGIAVTPYQPLQSGLLTGKYRRGMPMPAGSRAAEHSRWLSQPNDELYGRLEQFEREACERRLPPAKYALRWLLEKPEVVSVVVGANGVEQLEQLIPTS